MGAVGNAPNFTRALNGQILEDEEGNESNPLSDGSEEGSDDSNLGNGNGNDNDYPLPGSWGPCTVDNPPEDDAPPYGLLPDFTPAGIGFGKAHDLSALPLRGLF